jgi:hypothetical protein
MTVAAPPRSPEPCDPVEREEIEDLEALIEEARQRTRTRRRRYAAVALAAGAAAGLSLYFFVGGGTSARPTDALASPPAAAPVAANTTHFELWFVRPSFPGACCVTYPTWRTAAQLGISPDEDIHTRRELSGPDENRRATDLLERVLRSLIAGPTPADDELLAERARDLGFPGWPQTWHKGFRMGTPLLGVTLSNGIATIDLASTDPPADVPPGERPIDEWFADPYGGCCVSADLLFSGLVLTATQFPFVDGVLFKLDGQPRKAQIGNVQAFNEAIRAGHDPSWDNPDFYERVGRPVTRADYEDNRGEDAISRQGPGT